MFVYVGCAKRWLREDEEHGAENDGDVSHLAIDFFDEQYGDENIEVYVECNGVDVIGIDAECIYRVVDVDGHQDDERDTCSGDYFDEALFKGLFGGEADRVHDGDKHEHVNHETYDKVGRRFRRHVPHGKKFEYVSVKEERADGEYRDEQEADGARCEFAQGWRFFEAFVNGGDFGKEQYGGDYARTEIENVEIDIAVEVGIEQLFKTKDKPFNGSE